MSDAYESLAAWRWAERLRATITPRTDLAR